VEHRFRQPTIQSVRSIESGHGRAVQILERMKSTETETETEIELRCTEVALVTSRDGSPLPPYLEQGLTDKGIRGIR
jgi:hypothetical protein